MLAMARILRTGVRMLLLDEPTEGLAPVIIERIGEVLAALKARGMTILLVEQNFRFASPHRRPLLRDGARRRSSPASRSASSPPAWPSSTKCPSARRLGSGTKPCRIWSNA